MKESDSRHGYASQLALDVVCTLGFIRHYEMNL